MSAVHLLRVLVVIGLLASSCTSDESSRSGTRIDQVTVADLQARAFERACRDVICAGAPIWAPDSTPDDVRHEISQFTDEVQYLTGSQVDEQVSKAGRFLEGATMIGVGRVRATKRADVSGVDVSISRGPDNFGRTYVFQWDGSAWVDTSAEAVSVTVTTSVS